MPCKYCANCQDIVCAATVPNFCGWCSKDLRNEPILPETETYKERIELLTKLRTSVPYGEVSKETEQLSLF